MKDNKIQFVRFRDFYIAEKHDLPVLVDVLYFSGRLFTYEEDVLPKTVRAFLRSATARPDFDKYWGFEIVYTIKKGA